MVPGESRGLGVWAPGFSYGSARKRLCHLSQVLSLLNSASHLKVQGGPVGEGRVVQGFRAPGEPGPGQGSPGRGDVHAG